MRLLRPLAERGSEHALLTLGWILEKGAAGATDKEAARLHDERAAALVSAAAHLELGRLLSSRRGRARAGGVRGRSGGRRHTLLVAVGQDDGGRAWRSGRPCGGHRMARKGRRARTHLRSKDASAHQSAGCEIDIRANIHQIEDFRPSSAVPWRGEGPPVG